MSNSKTRAWKKLTELTGRGNQGLSYIDATTEDITKEIDRIEDKKKVKDRAQHAILLYNKSVALKEKEEKIKKKQLSKRKLLFNPVNKDIDADENCAICLNKFDTKTYNDILTLKCNHTFHHHCIRELIFLYTDDKCPLCRRVFDYKLVACKKIKDRLRKKIIKHHSNACDRIPLMALFNLGIFLFKKKIKLRFIEDFLYEISVIGYRELSTINYCSLDGCCIYLFTNEFCDNHGGCCKGACYVDNEPNFLESLERSHTSFFDSLFHDIMNDI